MRTHKKHYALYINLTIALTILSFLYGYTLGSKKSINLLSSAKEIPKINRLKKPNINLEKKIEHQQYNKEQPDYSKIELEIVGEEKINTNCPYSIESYRTDNPEKLKKAYSVLEKENFTPYIIKIKSPKSYQYILRTGPYRNRYSALRDLEKIKRIDPILQKSFVYSE